MAYEVRLSHRANKDLVNIYEEKSVEFSRPAAAWYLGLRDTIFSLETLPTRGVITKDDPNLRHLLYGNRPHIYRILYSIDEVAKVVNVAQIRHGARRPLRVRSE